MAKRRKHRPEKISLGYIFKGNFLYREEIRANYRFFILIFVFMMFMIFMDDLTNQKIKKIIDLKEKTEEYKSRNAYAQSMLINVKMESELGKEMIKDSLKPLENHPHKLLIKIDEK